MLQLLKKLLDKLEPPANDWVLSRFGGYEGPESTVQRRNRPAASTAAAAEPASQSWFEEGSPPSGNVSSNAPVEVSDGNIAAPPTPERKSRAS